MHKPFKDFDSHVVKDENNGKEVVNAVFVADQIFYDKGNKLIELAFIYSEFKKARIPFYLYHYEFSHNSTAAAIKADNQKKMENWRKVGIEFSELFTAGYLSTYTNAVFKGNLKLGLVIDTNTMDVAEHPLCPARLINPNTDNLVNKLIQIKDLMISHNFFR